MYLGPKVYAIIHIVSPAMAANSSYPAGRWLVDHRFIDTKEQAEQLAAQYNRARYIKDDNWQLYTVEAYYEWDYTNHPKSYPKAT
jgi:hypothetical protein